MKNIKDIIINYIDNKNRKFLLKYLPKNGIGCEIGVFEGVFSKFLLDNVKPKKLYLIDPFSTNEFKKAKLGHSHSGDDYFQIVSDKIKKYPNAEIIRKTSDCLKDFNDNFFDWIYIDGNHNYDYVLQDLLLSYAKIKTQGLILGDDYETVSKKWDDGVFRAVNEFSMRIKQKPIIKNNQFIFQINEKIDVINSDQ